MRHLTAARLGDDGWHYVSLSRRGGYPLGYCSEHAPHPTEHEARECYNRWRRDQLRLDGKAGWTNCQQRADGARCANPANQVAEVWGDGGYTCAVLCPEHLTASIACEVLGLNGPAGDAWQS
jgi:hypothetical protein